jgi:protocadherin Fat 1/2/3
MFECKETDVAKRLTTILAESEKNNFATSRHDDDDDASKMPSRFGSNIHRPELENVPALLHVNESTPPGSMLFKARQNFFNFSYV